ncbi:MAG: hypothetical protein M1822_006578 [Bathelium mastoideum]|nr:MAG: hypothetical protein M1822_006578 [Bathelium mastoideum]
MNSARKATDSQNDFWGKIQKHLRREEIQQIEVVVEDYDKSGNIDVLQRKVEKLIAEAEDEKNKLSERRGRGSKRVSTHLQHFLKTFSDFVSCYSQIVDIVKEADFQSGGAAVAKHKQRKENLIEKSLGKIQIEFPRLKGLREIYPTEQMQALVAQVYEDVICFAQKSAEYYRRSAWRRVWQAISDPPQIGVEIATTSILDILQEVRREAHYGLDGRVKNIENITETMQQKVEIVQQKTADLELKMDNMKQDKINDRINDRLETLRNHLVPGDFSSAKEKSEYNKELQLGLTMSSKNLQTFNLNVLDEYSEYKTWRQSKEMRSLILRGKTISRHTPLSWLSPVAVELIDMIPKFETSKGTTVLFGFCKREYRAEKMHMHTLVSRMILQLLEAQPELLQDQEIYQKYATLLTSREWQEQGLKTACKLCVDILSHFSLVYLIIDRLEECRSGESGLIILLEMVEENNIPLKTLVIVDKDQAEGGQVENWQGSLKSHPVDVIDGLDQLYL